jgi:hypothetical protein
LKPHTELTSQGFLEPAKNPDSAVICLLQPTKINCTAKSELKIIYITAFLIKIMARESKEQVAINLDLIITLVMSTLACSIPALAPVQKAAITFSRETASARAKGVCVFASE